MHWHHHSHIRFTKFAWYPYTGSLLGTVGGVHIVHNMKHNVHPALPSVYLTLAQICARPPGIPPNSFVSSCHPPPPSLPGPGPPCPRPDIGHLDFPALARGGRLEGCTVAELKEFCRQKALLRSGKKADLILRIEAGGFLRGVHEPPIGMSSTATVICTWVVPPSLCSRGLLKTNFLHGGGRVGLEFGLPYTGGVPSF